MHFPGRDLRPYAEPVPADALIVGETYFTVSYYDEAMLAPELKPLVYLGRDLSADPDAKGFYFQDAASHTAGTRCDDCGPDEAEIYCQRPGEVHVMDFEHALDLLLACSIRRRERTDDR